MELKKPKWRREPSFDDRFIWAGFTVFLIVLLVVGIAKFSSLKTSFWLEHQQCRNPAFGSSGKATAAPPFFLSFRLITALNRTGSRLRRPLCGAFYLNQIQTFLVTSFEPIDDLRVAEC